MEFSPFVRGPKTVARSLILPTPSTIAGTLATLCLDAQKAKPPRASEWKEKIMEVLNLEVARLKGPYLIMERDKGEEVYTQFMGHLAKLDEIVRAVQSLDLDLRDASIAKKKKLKELLEEKHVNFYQPIFTEKVGINVERKYKRAVEGGLYNIQMIDYARLYSEKKEIIVGKMINNVSVGVDVYGRSKISNLEKKENILRFGGEGKLSYLLIKEGEIITSKVEELLAGFKKGEAYLYLITYSLYKSSKEHMEIHEICKGGYVTPSIFGRVNKVLREISPSIKISYIIGECNIFGAGYSINMEARKPIYEALLPGTIIKIEGTKEDLVNLYKEGISEIGSEIGFGTVIPIPITR
jgi:CRISPR-associated protein Cmr3